MLTHIVLLQPKPESTQEDIRTALKAIEDLQQYIPEILDIQIGPSLSIPSQQKGYTHGFVMHFEGKTQLDSYAANPIHHAASVILNRAFHNIINFDIS